MKVKVSYKMRADHNWHKPLILELTRVPSIGEYVHTVVNLIDDRLCHIKLVIHTPANTQYVAEVYGDWVMREETINAADNFDNY
jgi:hypothetical protein